MSKPARKSRPAEKLKPTHKKKITSSTKILLVFVIVAVLAAIPFCMGKYFEFNFPGPYDSAANVYSAKHILEGAEIGVDEIPSAALGTLLMNVLGVWLFGFSEFGPKLIQAILQAGSLVLMFIAMRRLFGRLAAVIGTIIASFYLSAPLIAKFGNVKEQYMIAFMIIGISCFVLRQLEGKWYWAVLAGAFVSWAPLFKETGTSAIGAIGIFVIAQPFFKNRTWKQTVTDIGLLVSGAALAIAPLYIWIIAGKVQLALPYSFVWNTLAKYLLPSDGAANAGSYVASSRAIMPFSEQWPKVLRYYNLLIVPIALAAGSIIARIIRMILSALRKLKQEQKKPYERFVLLLGVWWLLDMAFVWISPRSYEQYYLPLNASAAMLGGYIIALYHDKIKIATHKGRWFAASTTGLLLMIIFSWQIFFGISKSPYSGAKYPEKRRGYIQNLKTASSHRKGDLFPWERAGEYIKNHSTSEDKIYVWGWYPGIYVKAQRLSPSPKAFTSEMHTRDPEDFEKRIQKLLSAFEKEMPKYIVDSRKNHVPMDRPPHELWPILLKGTLGLTQDTFMPQNKTFIERFEKSYSSMLSKRFGEDEALRFMAVKPFREFIMTNYEIVEPVRAFLPHIVFRLKSKSSD